MVVNVVSGQNPSGNTITTIFKLYVWAKFPLVSFSVRFLLP